MKAREAPVVVVIGAATCTEDEVALAEEVGRLLAGRGAMLACGGGGGVMEAACRGARQAGGFTIGILPGSDASLGNRFLSLRLPTGMGNARNAVLVLAGQSVIAVGGGYGTLSEIGLALKSGRKVIGLRTWEAATAAGQQAPIHKAHTPQEAVDLALGGGG